MRLIVGADSLLGPPTGIGNYTRNLCIEYAKHTWISDLALFSHTGYIDSSFLFSEANASEVRNSDKGVQQSLDALGAGILPRLIKSLSGSHFAAWCYLHVHSKFRKQMLKRYGQSHVFHSPNFVLPEFSGPRFVTVHDLSTLKFPQFHPSARVKLVEKMIKKTFDSDANIIAISDSVRHEMIMDHAVNESRISVIPNGISHGFADQCADEEAVLAKYGIQRGKFFLCVATIEPRKNISRLCSAYNLFIEQTKLDWPLIFVGDEGWNSQDDHAAISHLIEKGLSKYLRYVNVSDLVGLYRTSKALIFPSLCEGFGLPIIEAQACGCPVVTSNIRPMSDLVSEQDILFDPYDIEAIAAGIVKSIHGLEPGMVRDSGPPRTWRDVADDTIRLMASSSGAEHVW